MSEQSLIRGEWLRKAMELAGASAYAAAKELGIKPDKFYRHFNDKNHLSSESLADLHAIYPVINLHFVLTGEGSPTLTPPA